MGNAASTGGGRTWFLVAGALLAVAAGCGSESVATDDVTGPADATDATQEVATDMAEALATDTLADPVPRMPATAGDREMPSHVIAETH